VVQADNCELSAGGGDIRK